MSCLASAVLAVAVASAAAGTLGIASLAAPTVAHAHPPALPRCYWIAPPLSQYEPALLNSGPLDCRLAECRLSLRPTPQAGWVCFFARPF